MKWLKDLNMKLDLQTTEIMQLKAKVADHEVTISDHEYTISEHKLAIHKHEVNQRWLFNDFINYLVQLLYGLEHALIISVIPNAYRYFQGQKAYHFDKFLLNPLVPEDLKNKLRTDLITLNALIDDNFKDVVDYRNRLIHQDKLEMGEIIFTVIEIGNCQSRNLIFGK